MFGRVKWLSRDDGNLLLFVKLLVKLLVSVSDISDESQSLVFGQNFKELDSQWVEIANAAESLVELMDFFVSNTSVLSEKLEGLRVLIKTSNILHIFIDGVEGLLLGSTSEEN